MKLDNETIVHRYGKALFELAEEMKIRNEFYSELQEYKKVLQNEPQLKVFMSSNQISPEAKLKIMEILKKDSSKLMTNLLDMLYDYGRITNLEGIIDEFDRLNDEFEKTVRASVITAIELDEERKQKLASSFANVVGAKKVIISAPAKDEETPTFIMGINHTGYSKDMSVVSNASCTTNCLAPICKVLEDNYGIEYGLMSTIHAATAKQKVVDSRSLKDWRTGRSAFGNLIPSTTGAAKAISLVIPSLKDKMSGISYRVPTTDVSIVDLNVALKESASYEDICKKVKEASMTYLSGILDYVDDEVVSSDFIGDSHASIFDARQGIQVNSHFFKVICFYDNEWGYTSQIFRLIKYMDQVDHNS